MARTPVKKNARQKKSTPAIPVGLALSDLRLRLEFLEQDNEKLLKKISKKRTEIDNLTDRIQAIAVEMTQRSAPVLQQMREIDQKIHQIFTEIFTGRKLGKQTQRDIQRVYRNLQNSGLISPKLNSDGQPESRRMFEDFPNFDISEDAEWDEYQAPKGFQDSAPKPAREELKKIRQLFLRLADVFHPDKAGPEADQDYHAEVMKELNQAYQDGDLAKLLAIEKQHQMGEMIDRDNADDLTRRCTRIEQENDFLKSQLDSLQQELRLAKNSPEGAMANEHRRLTKVGIDPISEVLAEAEEQCQLVQDVHDFVAKFRDRKITIKEFLQGPPAIQQLEEINMEELLMEFAEFSGIDIHFSR